MATSFSKPFLTKHVFPKQLPLIFARLTRRLDLVVKKDVKTVTKISLVLSSTFLKISSRMNAYKEQDFPKFKQDDFNFLYQPFHTFV